MRHSIAITGRRRELVGPREALAAARREVIGIAGHALFDRVNYVGL